MEDSPDASRVFLGECWAAEVPPGYEVPGWFFLRNRRHAERFTDLDDDEVAAFGRHAHDLVAALESATGAPAVYLMAFGENHHHFHVLVTARGEEVPPAQRGAALLGRLATHRDPAAAATLVPRVREAYEQILHERHLAGVA